MSEGVITGGNDLFPFNQQQNADTKQDEPENTGAQVEQDEDLDGVGEHEGDDTTSAEDDVWGAADDDGSEMAWKDLSESIDLSSVDLTPAQDSGGNPFEENAELSDGQQLLMDQIADGQPAEPDPDEPDPEANKSEPEAVTGKRKLGFKDKMALLFRKDAKPDKATNEDHPQPENIPVDIELEKRQAEPVNEVEVERESPSQFQRSGIALTVSLVLSLSAIGMSSYTFMTNKDNAFRQEIGNIRDDLVQKVDKVESEALNSSAKLSMELKTLTETLGTLTHKLDRVGQQVDDLKLLSDKMGSDNELSLSWSRQTRGMVDDASKSIVANESAINELRLKIEEMQSAIKKSAAVRQAAARQAAVVKKKKAQGPMTEFAGYKLFSVDDWGGF